MGGRIMEVLGEEERQRRWTWTARYRDGNTVVVALRWLVVALRWLHFVAAAAAL